MNSAQNLPEPSSQKELYTKALKLEQLLAKNEEQTKTIFNSFKTTLGNIKFHIQQAQNPQANHQIENKDQLKQNWDFKAELKEIEEFLTKLSKIIEGYDLGSTFEIVEDENASGNDAELPCNIPHESNTKLIGDIMKSPAIKESPDDLLLKIKNDLAKKLEKNNECLEVEISNHNLNDSLVKDLFKVLDNANTSMENLLLDFSNCIGISDEVFSSLQEIFKTKHLPKKLILYCGRCPQIRGIRLLSFLTNSMNMNLKVLEIHLDGTDCSDFGGKQATNPLWKLESCVFNLTGAKNLTCQGLRNLLSVLADRSFPQKLELYLGGCSRLISELSNGEKLNLSTSLKDLVLWFNDLNIPQANHKSLANWLGGLDLTSLELNFYGCKELNNYAMIEYCNIISRMQNLQVIRLDFGRCPEFNNECSVALQNTLCSLKKLESLALSFSGCSKVIIQDGKMNANFPKTLKDLMLVVNETGITDEGIKEVCEHIAKLEVIQAVKLYFKKCEKLTENGVKSLEKIFKSNKSLQRFEVHTSVLCLSS